MEHKSKSMTVFYQNNPIYDETLLQGFRMIENRNSESVQVFCYTSTPASLSLCRQYSGPASKLIIGNWMIFPRMHKNDHLSLAFLLHAGWRECVGVKSQPRSHQGLVRKLLEDAKESQYRGYYIGNSVFSDSHCYWATTLYINFWTCLKLLTVVRSWCLCPAVLNPIYTESAPWQPLQ